MWKIASCTDDFKKTLDKYEGYTLFKLIALFQADDSYDVDELTYERPLPPPDFGLLSQGPDEVEPPTDPNETLVVMVDGTKDVGGFMNKHTEYVIKYKTSYPHYPKGHGKVQRRYNHFVWLHKRLTERYPEILIPPLPEKQVNGRFASDFIETRRLALQTFFNNIISIKELEESVDVMVFLTASSKGIEGATSIMTGIDKMGFVDTLKSVGGMVTNMGGKQVDEEDQEFADIDVELDKFHYSINNVQEGITGMINKQKAVATQIDTVATGFSTLADISEDAPEENDYWSKCSTSFGDVAVSLTGHCEDLRLNLLTPIGFTKNKVNSISSLIKNRQRSRQRVKLAEEDVKKKSKAVTEAKQKGGKDKIQNAKDALDDARDERADRRKKARAVLVGLKEGYVKFEGEKISDLFNAFKNYATTQSDYYKKVFFILYLVL